MTTTVRDSDSLDEAAELFTMEHFWAQRLGGISTESISETKGWHLIDDTVETFLEAPLYLSDEFISDYSPLDSPLILVSAPGAVGKTTLAREIARRTGALYIDLAQSEPVGGHTLSGGLVRAEAYERWKAETTTVLLDGLDEARLRVTQEAFEAFLGDVCELSIKRKLPTIIFGRSGSVQDAWYILAEKAIEVPVLEIGYYGIEDAIEFTHTKLRSDHPHRLHPDTDRQAISLLLQRIRNQTESDGDRFAGYAPVLQAVAEQVAKERNVAALVSEIEKGEQQVTLQDVVSSILRRERTKLEPLSFEDPEVSDTLYLAEEQLEHLASKIYGGAGPELPPMSPIDAKTYENALKTWVDDHPFLDGNNRPSSAVFDAVVATWTMRHSQVENVREAALSRELARGMAANPFLSEIYISELDENKETHISPEHIGIVYASLRARLSLGDTASMMIEAVENGDEDGSLRAEVELSQQRKNDKRARVVELQTDKGGFIRLGAYVEDVEVVAPESCIEFGPSNEAVLVTPISIQCDLLSIESATLMIEPSPNSATGAVYLEANDFSGHMMTSVPVLRGAAKLTACWPGARMYPWTSFAAERVVQDDPMVEEALRRLRKFVISFRSHSRGSLARYSGKIEHRRMTKGTGQAVLELMLAKGILSLRESMYFLDADNLAALTGLSYLDCMECRFGEKAVEFVKEAL